MADSFLNDQGFYNNPFLNLDFGAILNSQGNFNATTPGQTAGSQTGTPPPATAPPPAGAGAGAPPPPPPPPPPNPMSFFRTDVGPTWNPTQYANQSGINSVQNLLGVPSSSFGQTYNQGPFGMPEQSVVNYGGQNHNTGLIQNLINQYGAEQAKAMVDAENAAAKAAGGGNWTLSNDASLQGYTGVRPDVFIPSSALTTPPQTYNAANYSSPAAFNQAQNNATQNALTGLYVPPTSQQNNAPPPVAQNNNNAAATNQSNNSSATNGLDANSFLGLLMLMMMMGGGYGGGQQQVNNQAANVNRNPSLYSLFY